MLKQALLAGGCFWGLQAKLKALPGVSNTLAAYTGGTTENPSYAEVCRQQTGHVEAVQLDFDPEIISYEQLLQAFFQSHDPVMAEMFGEQYRSVIFYYDDSQKEIAQKLLDSIKAAGVFKDELQTILRPVEKVWPAEDYHQDYYGKHNVISDDDCYCHRA